VGQAEQIASIASIQIRPAAIRPAEPGDLDAVAQLLSDAAAWTAAIGLPNWPSPFPREVVTRGVADQTLHVAEHDGSIVATVNLQWSDAMFWGERPPDAGYVHRLVVRRDRTGAGLGATVLDWASEQVRAAGRDCLRLDVSADNLPLSSYYERLGFAYRGDRGGELTEPDGRVRRWKTRLYERDCHEENRT
jgi:GNAT superfamily N-acetyltransferase